MLITLFMVVMGCAEERPPRSYVQPHVVAKTDFTGEWYYIPTVVDIGFTSTVTFIGEAGWDAAIIRWDIQENSLIARLAYDRIKGAETDYHDDWVGEVIGAWGINHFDIIRDYNASTGEELNIIRETTERPWYLREFMRIDWSKNRSSSWAMFWPHVIKVDPVGYSVTDPDDPHYPKYVRNDKGELTYIEITENVIMGPEMRSLDGWDFMGLTKIPDCYFYGTLTTCNASQVMVRHAFRKLDPDNEYEPHEYTQWEHDKFGYFMSARLTYNRQYGVTIQQLKEYANKWNFFQESFIKATTQTEASLYADRENHQEVKGQLFHCPGDGAPCRYRDDNTKIYIMGNKVYANTDVPDGDRAGVYCPGTRDHYNRPNPCFWKDDGQVYIARNPDWTENRENSQPVPIRYANRVMRPMVYYANSLTPASIASWELDAQGNPTGNMTGPMMDVYDDWARSHNTWLDHLKVSRLGSKGVEQQSVQICPYIPKDDTRTWYAYGSNRQTVCEKDVRLGDIRFPAQVWIDAPQQYSPLGYGPPLPDPLTGESFSAASNIYGAALDSYAGYARDMVRLLTDPNMNLTDYLTGDYMLPWLNKHPLGTAGKSMVDPEAPRLNWQRTGEAMSQDRIRTLFRNMDTGWARGLAPHAPLVLGQGEDAFKNSWDKRIRALSQTGALGDGTGVYLGYSRLNRLRDTPIEDRMMTRDVILSSANTLLSAGYDPIKADSGSLAYGSTIRAQVSPLTQLNLKYIRAMNDLKFKHFAQKGCVMYTDFSPFEDPASVAVARRMVETHCGGSWEDGNGGWDCGEKIYDALRGEIYVGVTIHEMGHNMGLRHNFKGTYDALNFYDRYWEIRNHDGTAGPRIVDPVTQYEIENGIDDYAYTSIMDYGAKFNSDFQKLGKYDDAAIAYAYGGLRQVFKTVGNDLVGLYAVQNFAEWGWPTAMLFFTSGIEAVHYTRFQDFADLRDSNRAWVPNRWIVKSGMGGLDLWMTDPTLDGGTRRVMVPYGHCSDEFRQSQLGCNYFDKGADLWEISQGLIEAYENYYVLNNFSRGRYTWGFWNEGGYVRRIAGRYFELLQNHVQYYALYLGIFRDALGEYMGGDVGVENFFTNPDTGWGFWTAAVADIFSTFMRVLTMPQPGFHQLVTGPNGEQFFDQNTDDPQYCQGFGPGTECEFYVPLISGKFRDDRYDYDYGYQWYMKMLRRGQFFDRALAIQIMAEAENRFMGRDTQEDKRQYTINFARLFPTQILDIFAGIQTNDYSKIAPAFCGTVNVNVPGYGNVPYAIVEHAYAADMNAPRCSTVSGTFQGLITPNNTFTIQLYAAVMGMAMFPMNYSQEFIDKSRIYVRGNAEGIDFSHLPPERIIEMEDPLSNKVFQALKYDDVVAHTGTHNVSLGARMIAYATELRDTYLNAKDAYDLDPSTNNYNEYQVTLRNYKNYVDNLEMVRGLTRMLEWADFTNM